jgi:hypothetical protein
MRRVIGRVMGRVYRIRACASASASGLRGRTFVRARARVGRASSARAPVRRSSAALCRPCQRSMHLSLMIDGLRRSWPSRPRTQCKGRTFPYTSIVPNIGCQQRSQTRVANAAGVTHSLCREAYPGYSRVDTRVIREHITLIRCFAQLSYDPTTRVREVVVDRYQILYLALPRERFGQCLLDTRLQSLCNSQRARGVGQVVRAREGVGKRRQSSCVNIDIITITRRSRVRDFALVGSEQKKKGVSRKGTRVAKSVWAKSRVSVIMCEDNTE